MTATTEHDGRAQAVASAVQFVLRSTKARPQTEQELRATSFQTLTHPDDLRHVQSYIHRVLEGYIESHEQEKRYIHEDGHAVWVLWHVSLLKESETGTKRLFFQVQDISDRKKAEEKLTQDTLTGLPNRARFYDLLKLRFARKQSNRQCAVLLLDVDRFKLVNDSLGNASADQLLIQIANRVKTCMRQNDVLARVGGDERLAARLLGDPLEQLGIGRVATAHVLWLTEDGIVALQHLHLGAVEAEEPDQMGQQRHLAVPTI